MAINTQKFLPSAKGGALIKASQKVISAKKGSSITLTEKSVKDIANIRVSVIRFESILKGTLAVEKKKLDEKKRKESGKRREKQEEKLETKSNVEKGQIKMPKRPRLGIFDWIKNFIKNIILGYFAVRLIDHLPKIMPIVKFLGSAADFIINVGGKLLNGLVTFVDWGYKAIDATRGFIKNLGGENFAQGFDKFIGAVDTVLFLSTVLATELATDALTDKGTPGGEIARKPAGVFGRGAARAATRFGLKTIGKGGTKAVLRAVRPLVRNAPLIGGLLEFGISWALGDPLPKAAFRGVGTALLGAVGTAIGGPIGLAIGGYAGGELGGVLYDMFFNNKKPSQKGKVQGKAGGGITRGGKTQGGVRRTIAKQKYKRVVKKIPREPGKVEIKSDTDVGQKEKVFDLFGFVKNAVQAINPFNTIKKSGEELGKTDYFGPILAVTSKLTLGQELTQRDYQNVGLGINMLIAKGIQEKQLKGGIIAAFAEGGFVDPDVLSAAETGGDISNWVSKTFKGEVESNAQKTLRMIRENSEKKKTSAAAPPSADDLGFGAGVQVTSDSEDFWLLATAAMFENSDPQGAADVAQVIYNRTQYPAWNAPTIRKAILNPGQFQPVSQYGGTAAWDAIKTKQDAIRFSKSHGKTIEQLERVAAALLDKSKQSDARSFVGPRDSFRAEAYEKANNHLANETEKTRHGHTFGFEPGGAMIGQFKAGKLSAARVNDNTIRGTISDIGSGSGEWRFGRTGRMSVAQGFSHAHFDSTDNESLIRDVVPLLKKMAASGLKPELADGTPILAGKDAGYYADIVRSGISQHTHRPGPRMDVNMPGFPRVPFSLKYSFYQAGGAGHAAVVPGSGKTQLFHMSKKSDGSAFHGENFGIVPKDGFMLKLHKGEMFRVIDKDSVDLLGYDLAKEIIDIENKAQLVARAPSIIEKLKAISGYASYEEGSQETIVISTPTPSIETDYDSYGSSSGVAFIPVGGGSDDPYETLYEGG